VRKWAEAPGNRNGAKRLSAIGFSRSCGASSPSRFLCSFCFACKGSGVRVSSPPPRRNPHPVRACGFFLCLGHRTDESVPTLGCLPEYGRRFRKGRRSGRRPRDDDRAKRERRPQASCVAWRTSRALFQGRPRLFASVEGSAD